MAAGAFFFKAAIQVLAVATVFWYLKGMDIGEIGDLREFTLQKLKLMFFKWMHKDVEKDSGIHKGQLCTIVFMIYYLLLGSQKPTLVHNASSKVSQHLSETCKSLTSKYWPTAWMAPPFVQGITQFAAFQFLAALRVSYHDPSSSWARQPIHTADKHVLTVDEFMATKQDMSDRKDAMLVVTSSCEGSHSYEVITFAERASNMGFRVFALNGRGQSNADCRPRGVSSNAENPLVLKSLSDPSDLKEALRILKKDAQYAELRFTLVSFEASAVMVLKYLEQEGARAGVESAVCISPALRLESLASPTSLAQKFHDGREVARLRTQFLHRHADDFEGTPKTFPYMQAADNAKSSAQFHERLSMRLLQLRGKEEEEALSYTEYLRSQSISSISDKITKPLLFVCSRDDPVYTMKEVMPPELVADISQHACATLVTAGRAGHCCLFEGMTASNWAARVAVEFAITTRNFGDESEKKQAAPQKGAKKAKGKAKAS